MRDDLLLVTVEVNAIGCFHGNIQLAVSIKESWVDTALANTQLNYHQRAYQRTGP